VVLFLGCVALGYFVRQQKTEITLASVQRAASEKETQARIVELQQQVAAAKAARAVAEKQAAQAAPVATPLPRSDTAGAKGGFNVIHISDILKEHPEYAALYAKQERRNIDRIYGDGLGTLILAPDQLSKLKDLLVERQMSNMDAQREAETAGLQRDSPAWMEAMKQASQDTQQQIAAIMGTNADGTLAQLQTRVRIQGEVEYTYRPDFSDAGVPLNPAQSSGLVQAMADANYTGKDMSTRPEGYNETDPTTGLTPHDNRILDSASRVLSPAQLQILKTDLIEVKQVGAIMQQYRAKGGPAMFIP